MGIKENKTREIFIPTNDGIKPFEDLERSGKLVELGSIKEGIKEWIKLEGGLLRALVSLIKKG